MDASSFDRLTRTLFLPHSRRRLGLAAGGVLAALCGAPLDDVEARACQAPAVKCKKDCCRGAKVCRKGKCRTCRGVRCPDGRCLAEADSCGGVCCDKGITCCDNVCCAAGESCSAAGTCTPCPTRTDNCPPGEDDIPCHVDDVEGVCATSAESGNFCVDRDRPCGDCTLDAECTARLGREAICITCDRCGPARLCAVVLAPA